MQQTNIVDDFKGFLVHDGIISIASGIILGISTTTFLKSLVLYVMLPALYMLLFNWVYFVAPSLEKNISAVYRFTSFDLLHFFQELITWIITVVATFLVLEFIVRRRILKDQTKFTTEMPISRP